MKIPFQARIAVAIILWCQVDVKILYSFEIVLHVFYEIIVVTAFKSLERVAFVSECHVHLTVVMRSVLLFLCCYVLFSLLCKYLQFMLCHGFHLLCPDNNITCCVRCYAICIVSDGKFHFCVCL